MKKFDKAYILAGGLATRLRSFTYNGVIPKVLLSLGQDTILDKIVESYSTVSEEVVIVAWTESHAKMLSTYCKMRELKCSIMTQCNYNGTFSAVHELVDLEKDNFDNAIIAWADLWPNIESIQKFANYYNTELENPHMLIAADQIQRHRLFIDIDEVGDIYIDQSPVQTGNICGIYAINKSFHKVLDYLKESLGDSGLTEKPDLMETLSRYLKSLHDIEMKSLNIDFVELPTIDDIGDTKKYREYLEKHSDNSTRYFNKIEFNETSVTKIALTPHAEGVMAIEAEFYEMLEKLGIDGAVFPKLIGSTGGDQVTLTIEKLNGYQTMFEFMKTNQFVNDPTVIYQKVMRLAKSLHQFEVNKERNCINKEQLIHRANILDCSIDQAAKHIEYIQVTDQRRFDISDLLNSVHPTHVFGNPVINITDAMTLVELILCDDEPLVFGHGDINSTNCMVNPNSGEIKLIDPRGVFGGVLHLTDKTYDEAKIIYGLTGYSEFNLAQDFEVMLTDTNNLIYPVVNPFELLDKFELTPKLGVCIGLCWLKLPAYIINNPAKAIAAYYTGLALINKYGKL